MDVSNEVSITKGMIYMGIDLNIYLNRNIWCVYEGNN